MNVRELKDKIDKLPNDMIVEFSTCSAYITDKVDVTIQNDKLLITAEKV